MSIIEEAIAIAKETYPELPESWKPYLFEVKDFGIIITGCETDIFKKGPKKNRVKYLTNKFRKTVLITNKHEITVPIGLSALEQPNPSDDCAAVGRSNPLRCSTAQDLNQANKE